MNLILVSFDEWFDGKWVPTPNSNNPENQLPKLAKY